MGKWDNIWWYWKIIVNFLGVVLALFLERWSDICGECSCLLVHSLDNFPGWNWKPRAFRSPTWRPVPCTDQLSVPSAPPELAGSWSQALNSGTLVSLLTSSLLVWMLAPSWTLRTLCPLCVFEYLLMDEWNRPDLGYSLPGVWGMKMERAMCDAWSWVMSTPVLATLMFVWKQWKEYTCTAWKF